MNETVFEDLRSMHFTKDTAFVCTLINGDSCKNIDNNGLRLPVLTYLLIVYFTYMNKLIHQQSLCCSVTSVCRRRRL